jgi:hypothetical protein
MAMVEVKKVTIDVAGILARRRGGHKMARFTVEHHPWRRGFCLRDSWPRLLHCEDVEGIGLVEYDPPKVVDPTFAWYKFKRDAKAKAGRMNEADRVLPGQTVEALIGS